MRNFAGWFEAIDHSAREVIVKKGEVLYHGTLESFDNRTLKVGGYDGVFWTAEDPMIARTYIPSLGSSLYMSADSLLRDRDEENDAILKSLGITKGIIRKAWDINNKGYETLKKWDDIKKSMALQVKQLEKEGKWEEITDEMMAQWSEAETEYKKAQQNWKTADSILKKFIVMKMNKLGYKDNFGSFRKVAIDRDGGGVLPASYKDTGRVLQVTCQRDFRVYNMARGRDGDLMDLDYHKIDTFRKLKGEGYDGVIINDFAQSDTYGNYGHRSVGFFRNALKDLKVKAIRGQTHPTDQEWQKEREERMKKREAQ